MLRCEDASGDVREGHTGLGAVLIIELGREKSGVCCGRWLGN